MLNALFVCEEVLVGTEIPRGARERGSRLVERLFFCAKRYWLGPKSYESSGREGAYVGREGDLFNALFVFEEVLVGTEILAEFRGGGGGGGGGGVGVAWVAWVAWAGAGCV